jgi:hypothetical protein
MPLGGLSGTPIARMPLGGLSGTPIVRMPLGGLSGTPIVRMPLGGLSGTPIVRMPLGGLSGTPIVRMPLGGLSGTPIDTFLSTLPFATGALAGSKVRTPSGADCSCRINFPVSRPRSGIPLADANDSAPATTRIGKYSFIIKSRNTSFWGGRTEKSWRQAAFRGPI